MVVTWDLRMGDCLGPEGLCTLPDKSVDVVITDPPYSKVVVTSAKKPRPISQKFCTGDRYSTRALGYQGLDGDMVERVSAELARLCRRWCVVFCDAESLARWRAGLEAGGLRHVRMGAWVAPNPTPQFTGDRPGTGWEACEIAHGPGASKWNGGGNPACWVENRPVNGSGERDRIGHPTPKPIGLMERLVRDFTDPGELVLDPFSGSGTTGVACIRLGRRFIGFERDERYHAAAVKRLAGTREQLGLFTGPRTKPKQGALL